MKPTEQGYLLLTSPLGDPLRRPISPAQMRRLKQRLKDHPMREADRQMIPEDLTDIGYSREQAEHILSLLSDTPLLDAYLEKAQAENCIPLTWSTPGYPPQVLERLKAESPGSLWAKGDLSLLGHPCVALVGSRDLRDANREFAQLVGLYAAQRGYVLVSGNARGADRTAQEACLAAGGSVICVIADDLRSHRSLDRRLLLSEDGFDLPFSAQRALQRNRVIHAMGICTFVAQSSFRKGGTWSGALQNLRSRSTPLYCFDDESPAAMALQDEGATLLTLEGLANLWK